jgi:hypothetical protein
MAGIRQHLRHPGEKPRRCAKILNFDTPPGFKREGMKATGFLGRE